MKRLGRGYLDIIAGGLLLLSGFLFFGPALRPESGEMLAGPDLAWFFHPTLSFTFASLSQGRLPLWNPYLFLGFPQFAEPQLATFYPLTWLAATLPAATAYGLLYAFHFGLAAAGGYVLLRQLGSGRPGALLAGVLLGYNGFMVAHLYAGHLTHLMTIAYAPWLLAAACWALRQRTERLRLAAAIVAGLPLGLAFLTGYAPFFPLLLLAVTLLMGGYAFNGGCGRDGRSLSSVFRQWLLLLISAGLLGAVQLLPALQFALRSSRVAGADYAFASSLSLPFRNLLTLLMPQLFGVPFTDVPYWAGPPLYAYWEHALYVGLLPLLLLGLATVVGKGAWRGWLWLALGALLLALGPAAALHRLLYQLIPGFALFRVPARFAYLFVLATAVVAGLMWDRWSALSAAARDRRRRSLLRALAWGGGAVLLLAVLAALAQGAAVEEEAAARLGNAAGQLVRLLLLGGLSLLLLAARPRRATLYGGLALCLLLVDLWGHGLTHVRTDTAEPALGWIMADLALPPQRTTYRVTSSGLPPNQAALYQFQHVGGYDDFRLQTAVTLAELAGADRRVGRMLGIRYKLIGPDKGSRPGETEEWALLTEPAGATIYQRQEIQPRAFIVHRLVPAADSGESERQLRQLLAEASFDPAEVAVVEGAAACAVAPAPDEVEPVSVVAYRPQEVALRASSAARGWLVLADLYYPGWEATVDGQQVPVLPTNYGLRGLCLPAGEHEIVFRFRPAILTYGVVGSGAGAALLLLALLFLLCDRFRARGRLLPTAG